MEATLGNLKLFKDVVENSTDAIGISTPRGIHYYQNRAFSELFGEIGSRPPESLYVDQAVGQAVFNTIMAGGQWVGEVKMYARDRRLVEIFLRAYANRNADGAITSLVGIHTDITERKRTERQQLKRLKMNDFFVRISTRCVSMQADGFDAVVDEALRESGQLTASDRSYLVVYDATRRTLTNTHEWCAEGVSSEIDVLQQMPSDIVRSAMERLLRFEEIHLPRVADLNGDSADLKGMLERQGIKSLFAVPIAGQGGLTGFLGFDSVTRERAWSDDDRQALRILANILAQVFDRWRAEDALTRSMDHLQATLNALPDLLFEVDREGCIFSFHAPHPELLYSGPDAFMGKTMRDLLPAEAARVIDAALAEAAETGAHHGAVYSLLLRDGVHWFELSIGAKPGRDDSDPRFVFLAHDITDRKRTEDALHRLNEELENRVAERTEQAENRTAQLRRLTGQLVHSEQRERDRIALILHDDLQQILVGALYHLHGTQAADPASFEETEALIRQAIKLSSSLTAELSPRLLYDAGLEAALPWLCRQMKATFGLDVQTTIKASVPADEAGVAILLYQSVRELLLNVVKHAAVGEALVELERTADGRVRVGVIDHGCGFDVTHAWSTAKGFGLCQIRERMEQIGGLLAIDSQPGKGTCVTLTAEIRKPEAGTSQSAVDQPPADISTRVNPAASASIRIVIADDHALFREGVVNTLNRVPGMRIVGQAADGAEAVAMVLRLQPEVVIMDVSMPIMNGIEATRAIREKLPAATIIGLSMYDEDDRAKAMREAGATAYVSKIAEPGKLLETILAARRDLSRERNGLRG